VTNISPGEERNLSGEM